VGGIWERPNRIAKKKAALKTALLPCCLVPQAVRRR